MTDSVLFIGLVITGVTQGLKFLAPRIQGIVTVLVAMAVGGIVGAVDTHIGIVDINIATGIMIGLGSVGGVTFAQKISRGTPTPPQV